MTDILSNFGRLVPGDSSIVNIFEDSETEGHNSDNKEDNKAGDDKSNNAGWLHFYYFDE